LELEVILDLFFLLFREDLRRFNFLAFTFGFVSLAILADIVSLFRDDRSEVLEHKAQARVHEEVFHALFLILVANIYEELLQDCISFHLSLHLSAFLLYRIIPIGFVHHGQIADLIKVLDPESLFNLCEDLIFGLPLAQDLDDPSQDSTSIHDGALLEVLCGQLPYGQWVATPLPALSTLYLFNRFPPPGLYRFIYFSGFYSLRPLNFLLNLLSDDFLWFILYSILNHNRGGGGEELLV
jgi:hypothetical protein